MAVAARPRSGGVLQPPVVLPPRKGRRASALVVLPDDWEPKAGVPATRADCPTERPCVYVRCKHHLWMVTAAERQGRRFSGGRGPASTMRLASATSCALDVAEAVRAGVDVPVPAIAAMLGVSDRRVRYMFNSIEAKLKANPDARAVLEEMLEGSRDETVRPARAERGDRNVLPVRRRGAP